MRLLLALCLSASPLLAQPTEFPKLAIAITRTGARSRDAEHLERLRPRSEGEFFYADSARGATIFGQADLPGLFTYGGNAQLAWPRPNGRPGVPTLRVRDALTNLLNLPMGAWLVPKAEAFANASVELQRRLFDVGMLFAAVPALGSVEHVVDTLAVQEGQDTVQAIRHRFSRVLGDTIVDRRAAVVIADSMVIEGRHRYWRPGMRMSTRRLIHERFRTVSRGRRLVDLELAVPIGVSDSLWESGTITEDDGFGEPYESPFVGTWVRTVIVVDAKNRGVPRPATTRDALNFVPTTDRSLRRLSGERLLEDSAAGLATRIINGGVLTPLGVSEYRVLRSLLEDPSRAFAMQIERGDLLRRMIERLLDAPPVLRLADIPPLCTEDACKAMANDTRAKAGSPLRLLGLVAAYTLEPARWADSLVRASAQYPILRDRARWVALGAATLMPANVKSAPPAPDADALSWYRWLYARDPDYRRTPLPPGGVPENRRPADSLAPPLVPREAGVALRLAEARTGQPYRPTLRARRATAPDSLRVILDRLLLAMGDQPFSDAELVALATTPSAPERPVLFEVLTKPALYTLAKDGLARVVARHLLNALFADSTLTPVEGFRGDTLRIERTPAGLDFHVIVDSLPSASRERATELGANPELPGFQWRIDQGGHLLTFGPVRQMGPIARMTFRDLTFTPRARQTASGGGFVTDVTMVQTREGWRLLQVTRRRLGGP